LTLIIFNVIRAIKKLRDISSKFLFYTRMKPVHLFRTTCLRKFSDSLKQSRIFHVLIYRKQISSTKLEYWTENRNTYNCTRL